MARPAPPWNCFVSAVVLALVAVCVARPATAATPSAVEALKLKPVQSEVDYDQPDDAVAAKCTLKPVKSPQASGWEVRDEAGNVLRRFLDTNRDNKVDQWCYFKDGIEVYRDVDSNYNRKADQYRWLGTAGTRWGLDANEDGQIDRWKVISPEEVSAEVVAALSNQDAARFHRVLLSADELRALRLGKAQTAELGKKIAAAPAGFEQAARRKPIIERGAQWVNFGGTRPGIVAAGTDGSQRDLEVYENAAAVVVTNDNHSQIIIGTLVRVGDAWRVIDAPRSFSQDQASTEPAGFFFQASLASRAKADIPVRGGVSPAVQKAIDQLEQIDKDLAEASTPEALAPLNARRADVLQELAKLATKDDERANWIRQLADTVSAAVQSGGYPDGVQRLETLTKQLQSQNAPPAQISYVKFRYLTAEYTRSLQKPDADFPKIQEAWLVSLEAFVKDFPTTKDAAEAMLQLAIAQEFAGKDDEAVKWYARISSEFPATQVARKADGAKRRIESIGKTLSLSGEDTKGGTVSLDALRGKVVLIHYWATWCGPCKQDLSVLKDMQAKYGKDNVAMLGINVDNSRADLDQYLAENTLPWPQLFEPGGLDSRLANELGILTLPTMILIDREGKVVNRNLQAGEVDTELRKLLR